jgi:hypothetical protein
MTGALVRMPCVHGDCVFRPEGIHRTAPSFPPPRTSSGVVLSAADACKPPLVWVSVGAVSFCLALARLVSARFALLCLRCGPKQGTSRGGVRNEGMGLSDLHACIAAAGATSLPLAGVAAHSRVRPSIRCSRNDRGRTTSKARELDGAQSDTLTRVLYAASVWRLPL